MLTGAGGYGIVEIGVLEFVEGLRTSLENAPDMALSGVTHRRLVERLAELPNGVGQQLGRHLVGEVHGLAPREASYARPLPSPAPPICRPTPILDGVPPRQRGLKSRPARPMVPPESGLGRSQVVRQWILIPPCGGSTPPAPASPFPRKAE